MCFIFYDYCISIHICFTSIKVTESEKSAAIGDDSNIAIWFVLTIACAVALVVLIMYMRKINASDR